MVLYDPWIKRTLDIVLSMAALALLSPFFVLFIILIRSDSDGSPFFIQERIGKGMQPFQLIKFRSMNNKRQPDNCGFEPGGNCRVTRIGKFLRKTKLDELPELFNVFKGDMSLVGPRPEVAEYVDMFFREYQKILRVRPGLSDYASIKYRDEETLLATQKDPEVYYRDVVLRDKINIARRYTEQISFKTDLIIILATIRAIINPE